MYGKSCVKVKVDPRSTFMPFIYALHTYTEKFTVCRHVKINYLTVETHPQA